MKVKTTRFKDLCIIDHDNHEDARGFFYELYHQHSFSETGLDVVFKQDNLSRSLCHTIRGLHFQKKPYEQGKLITVLEGEVFDVAIDLRREEPTFGQTFYITLNSKDKRSVYIPQEFAHGFLVLSDYALFFYKCTNFYSSSSERTILWNDPQLNIPWPLSNENMNISSKDKQGRLFKDIIGKNGSILH